MEAIDIQKIIHTISELTGNPIENTGYKKSTVADYLYSAEEVNSFIYDLIDGGRQKEIAFTKSPIPINELANFLESITFPVVLFTEPTLNKIEPVIIHRKSNDELHVVTLTTEKTSSFANAESLIASLPVYEYKQQQSVQKQTLMLTSFPIKYYSEGADIDDKAEKSPPTTLQRLFRLLATEKKDIGYIYVYAVVVGLISLTLPLGIQAIIGMVSGGMFFSSVIVLISIIIVGILASGALQIMQVTLVEVLQQRIFARAAFEFAFRVPKIKPEALFSYYPPELMNRFFDVVVIQKSLPKILVDISGSVLQMLFGLVLLSFYHPAFLAFGLILMGILFLLFRFTGPKGLETSLTESKYKYKIVAWLEEIARTFPSFRLAGDSNLHLDRMDEYVNNYLYYRQKHFSILRSQFVYIVLFKTLIIGGLLIMGAILVVDRQISLGQFVASEVIVVLVVGAVEKIIFSMDNVYDLLTATEKVGSVTDLPLEKERGTKVKLTQYNNGIHVKMQDVNYLYPDSNKYALQDIQLELKPGERVGIAGTFSSGRHTLANLLVGSINTFEGAISINTISLRDIQPTTWHSITDSNLFAYDIFDGTILENISMNRARVKQEDVWWALEHSGLSSYVNKLPEGINTRLSAIGRELSRSTRHKLILARSIASKPKLLLFNDDMQDMQRTERQQLMAFLTRKENPWTLVSITNDPVFLGMCDKVVLMNESKIVEQGSFNTLSEHPLLKEVSMAVEVR